MTHVSGSQIRQFSCRFFQFQEWPQDGIGGDCMWGGQPAMHVHALGIWTKHSGQFSMLPSDICILQLKLVNQICQEQLNKF